MRTGCERSDPVRVRLQLRSGGGEGGPSGMWVPETAKEKPQKGEVLSVGPGARDDEGKRIVMDVRVGDKVLFAKYAGTEVKIENDKLLILRESDILAILEE